MLPDSMHSARSDRRQFLHDSTRLLVAGTVAGSLGISRAAFPGGDETIRVGLIGCGGRGTGAVNEMLSTPGSVKLVAVADAFEDRMEMALQSLTRTHQDKIDVPRERRFVGFRGYRQVLESNVDVVVLATPPGFRPQHFDASVRAGKHVFMEKPVATDVPGVRRVLAANELAKQKGLAVAVGLQRHHEAGYVETMRRLHDGAIGEIILGRAYWNMGHLWVRERQPQWSEMEYQMRNWYYFNWLCGDHIVEQHIHNLDVINWLMRDYPISAQGQGGRQVRNGVDHGQIFDHHFVEFTYANGAKMLSQCRHMEGCWNSVSEFAHGTKGTADISGFTLFDASGKESWKHTAEGVNGWQQEQTDLISALRRGETPNEGDYGAMSTMTAILGRMATYSGRLITMSDAMQSVLVEAPVDDFSSMNDVPPVVPDSDGRYPIPVPGVTEVLRMPVSAKT